jgi:transcriptional regulator with XRE-family HTH domain
VGQSKAAANIGNQADLLKRIFRKYRKQAGLTQMELAERVPMSISYVRAIETKGKPNPSRGNMLNIAGVLGLKEAERAEFMRAAGYDVDKIILDDSARVPKALEKAIVQLMASGGDEKKRQAARQEMINELLHLDEKIVQAKTPGRLLLQAYYCLRERPESQPLKSQRSRGEKTLDLANRICEIVELLMDDNLTMENREEICEHAKDFFQQEIQEKKQRRIKVTPNMSGSARSKNQDE